MPSLGADMDEGTLVSWLVAVGDRVTRGDIVAVVQTEKSDIEVEVFETGQVAELLVEPGTTVEVGTPLARIDSGSTASASRDPEPTPGPQSEARPVPRPVPAASPARRHAGRVLSPLVRRDARRLGIDLGRVRPAPDGTIHRDDIAAAARPAAAMPAARPTRRRVSPYARRLATERNIDVSTLSGTGPSGAVVARDVPGAAPAAAKRTVDPMRTAIARTMERSNREIPHYYLSHTVDMAATVEALAAHNDGRSPRDRVLLAALELRAVALAARKVDEMNGSWVDGTFVPGDGVHVATIVALRGGGLLAPVIRDADRLDADETMRSLGDVVERARRGALRSSELSGATITVTNLGEDGVEAIFGVIHPPQVAIVGFGGLVERPVVTQGRIVAHPTLTVTLAADHRATDGRIGGRFLARVAALLRSPERLL